MTTARRQRPYGQSYGASEAVVKKLTKTLAVGMFTAAATSEAVAIGALPAGATVLAVNLHTFTPFTGGAISAAVMDIGSTGDVDALIDGANVFTAAVDGAPASKTLGIAPNKRFASRTTINATLITTNANVSVATAGAVTVDIFYTLV